MITDEQIIDAGRVLLQARKERGLDAGSAANASALDPVVANALDAVTLPTDDAKAKGPSSPFSDAEIAAELDRLEVANASFAAKRRVAQSVLGFFGLGSRS